MPAPILKLFEKDDLAEIVESSNPILFDNLEAGNNDIEPNDSGQIPLHLWNDKGGGAGSDTAKTVTLKILRAIIYGEVLGAGDSVITEFNLGHYPIILLSDKIYVDAVLATRVDTAPDGVTEYTINHSTGLITFGSAPLIREECLAATTILATMYLTDQPSQASYLKLTVAAGETGSGNIHFVGTDPDGGAQEEDITFTANGIKITTKRWNTVTTITTTGFTDESPVATLKIEACKNITADYQPDLIAYGKEPAVDSWFKVRSNGVTGGGIVDDAESTYTPIDTANGHEVGDIPSNCARHLYLRCDVPANASSCAAVSIIFRVAVTW